MEFMILQCSLFSYNIAIATAFKMNCAHCLCHIKVNSITRMVIASNGGLIIPFRTLRNILSVL